jgi:hypothetical protein
MLKVVGLVLIAAGTALLWHGGVPYTSNEPVVKLGPLEARADIERKLEVPRPVSAGAIGAGALLLLVAGGRRRK